MDKYEAAYGKRVTDEVEDECIGGGFHGNYPGLRVQQLVKRKHKRFLRVPAFARVVNRLIMGSAKGYPTVQFEVYGGADHTEGGVQFFPTAMTFLGERFAGHPLAGNCADIGPGSPLAPLTIRKKR